MTVRAAGVISACTLLSRVLGFVRDLLMLRTFGASWVTGTFIIAWVVPNLLRRLFGEGALAASFIPAYARTRDRDGPAAGDRLLASVSGGIGALLALLSATAVALCFTLPGSWVGNAEGDVTAAETGALLLRLGAILFPYSVLICITALFAGALNSLSVFGWPAAMPVVLNVFWIGGLVAGRSAYPDDHEAIATLTAVCLLAAGFVQVAILGSLLFRRGRLPAPRLPGRDDPARAVFRAMLPTVLGLSVVQLNTLLDQMFAYYLIDPGANSHVFLANRLFLFPHALTSLALATAVFPRFAVLASRDQLGELRGRIDQALQLTLLLAVPASAGLMLIAGDFVELFFVGDRFTTDAAELSAATTVALVGGLPFIGASQLYARALFALGDLRGPALIAAALVPVNLGLNALFVLVLDTGVPGLTLATSLCAVLNAAALRHRVARRCARPGRMRPAEVARILAATAGMVAIVIGARAALRALEAGAALELFVPIGGGMLAYGALVLAMGGGEELRRLRRRGR